MNSNLRRWAALVIVCFGQLMIVLDTTIVNVALPSMQRDLRFSQADLTWVVNSYLIAYGSFLLVAGRAGDLFGRRKVFLTGVLLFTVASFGTGMSTGAQSLIVGRFLQGLGGSLAAGVILAIIVAEFSKPGERARAMSVFTLVAAGGGSIGLLAGGALTQLVNWHWIFFINVPIGVATLVLGAWLVEENEGLEAGGGIDVLGSLVITAAMMLGVYAIVTAADAGWTSVHTLGFGAAAVVLVMVFVALEWRLENPLIPVRILRLRSLTGGSAVRAFLVAGMFTNFFIGSLYLQHIKGMDAIGVGLAFLPSTLTLATFSAAGITAWLMARFGARNLAVAGLATIATALFVLSGADEQSAYFPRIFAGYLLFGIGAGTAFLPLLAISMSEVPTADAGVASGFGNVAMQVGAAVGLAAVGTISTTHTTGLVAAGIPVQAALTSGYQLAFLIAAASVAAGVLVILAVLRPGGSHVAERARLEGAEAEAA